MSPLDTITAINTRRSVRTYDPKPIPPEDIKTILESARIAPSAANRQPWHFVVVRDSDLKQQVAAACRNQHWIAQADIVIVGLGYPEVTDRWYRVDVAIALQNVALAAASVGYGTCWIGAFANIPGAEDTIKNLLQAPSEASIVAIMPVGFPAEQPTGRGRKPVEEIFSLDRFGQELSL